MMHGVAITGSPTPAGETYPMHNGDCKVTVATTLLAVGTALLRRHANSSWTWLSFYGIAAPEGNSAPTHPFPS